MSAAPATQPSLDLTIGVDDLTDASHLKSLLQGDAKPVFEFGAQLAPYWGVPIQNVPNGTSATITVSGSGSWKTKTSAKTPPIGFGLSGAAKCQLKVVTNGAVITYTPDLLSDATSQLP